MPIPSSGARGTLGGLVLAALLPACEPGGGGIDGKYFNSRSGEFALELQGGKVLAMQGQEGRAMTYAIRGDSLVIHRSATQFRGSDDFRHRARWNPQSGDPRLPDQEAPLTE